MNIRIAKKMVKNPARYHKHQTDKAKTLLGRRERKHATAEQPLKG